MRVRPCGVAVFAVLAIGLTASAAQAAIIGGLTPADLAGATITSFNPAAGGCGFASFDYGNGMAHTNLNGDGDCAAYAGSYGMGDELSIAEGRAGTGDAYFGTGPTPTTFEFAFAAGVQGFGFYGAESRVVDVGDSGDPRNGVLDLEFYDLSNTLLGSVSVTTAGVFAWDQFHGFMSDGSPIGRVVFNNVGHMVVDDVHFGDAAAPIPEPATVALVGLGLAGLGLRRRRG